MKLKALLCAALSAAMLVGAGIAAHAEEDVVSVMLNNEKVEFDQNDNPRRYHSRSDTRSL